VAVENHFPQAGFASGKKRDVQKGAGNVIESRRNQNDK